MEELSKIIGYVVQNCVRLKNKYVNESMDVDYICIFSQNQEEYDRLQKLASELGPIADKTKSGPVFKFNNPPQTIAGKPKLLKIRIPDATRPQRGDADFSTDYENFKKKYLNSRGFSLIVRPKFEMLELRDDNFDVLVYFSSIPQSKLLGVS